MKILGIDGSGLVAGVAIADGDILLAEYNVNYKKTHSQTLLPMLDEVKRMIDLDMESINAIAVTSGPGSFTGLRIGSATAKGLGLALGKPIVEVPTLECLAYNLCGARDLICPLIDARRNQVYTGVYVMEGDALRAVVPQTATDIADIIGRLNEMADRDPACRVIFLGDGVPVYKDRIKQEAKISFSFAPASANRQRAGSVAALGAVYFAQGKVVSAAEHRPEYLRKSQAERERQEAEKSSGNESDTEIDGKIGEKTPVGNGRQETL